MNPSTTGASYDQRTIGDPLAEDAALIQRIASGDESALATLYDRWLQPVYSLVSHLLRDADEAEDVVEETFWQVWQRAASFDASRGTVRAWLLMIGRSRALDRMRARQRHTADLPDPDAYVSMVTADTDPGLDAEGADRRAHVLAALDELPAEQRQVLELAYFRGLSQTEIAEYLGQPLGTVKTRMRLGMQKLRERLVAFREEVV